LGDILKITRQEVPQPKYRYVLELDAREADHLSAICYYYHAVNKIPTERTKFAETVIDLFANGHRLPEEKDSMKVGRT
jgi:hypothetical protein